jgi:hypothetical protein
VGLKGITGNNGAKGNILAGGYFEWSEALNKLTFKQHGYTPGSEIWIVETYLSGSY